MSWTQWLSWAVLLVLQVTLMAAVFWWPAWVVGVGLLPHLSVQALSWATHPCRPSGFSMWWLGSKTQQERNKTHCANISKRLLVSCLLMSL